MDVLTNKVNNAPLKIQRVSNMNVPRANPKTIALNNNNALIIGGNSNNTIELFDSKEQKFKLVKYNKDEENVCCPDTVYLKNGNVVYRGMIYIKNKNKFTKPPKQFKDKCTRIMCYVS